MTFIASRAAMYLYCAFGPLGRRKTACIVRHGKKHTCAHSNESSSRSLALSDLLLSSSSVLPCMVVRCATPCRMVPRNAPASARAAGEPVRAWSARSTMAPTIAAVLTGSRSDEAAIRHAATAAWTDIPCGIRPAAISHGTARSYVKRQAASQPAAMALVLPSWNAQRPAPRMSPRAAASTALEPRSAANASAQNLSICTTGGSMGPAA
mmetsp:Transcript_9322/g.29054  ORF Transcript_9322/g.29054 Transcript_9322/m.29054 type:complete len:209 (+) Transcript_9322:113-739(+)